jgi:hypothetical protein
MSTSWVDFTNSFWRHCTDRHCLVYFWNQIRNKIFASWTKTTLLRIYFRNLYVHRSFLQYKIQCLEKVNVKYVIKRLWHEIFHIVPGINPRPISALQLRCRAWYGSLRLIPGPIWKMSCNNLLICPVVVFMDPMSWTGIIT